MRILQKSPFAPTGPCILPSSPAEEFKCFLSLPVSICLRGWEQSSPVSTPYALLKVSSNSHVVHAPRWPTSEPGRGLLQRAPCCQGCAVLRWHCASPILAAADFFRCLWLIQACKSTVKDMLEAWPRTLFEDPSYAHRLLFLQPLSPHTMYLLVCRRMCRFLALT